MSAEKQLPEETRLLLVPKAGGPGKMFDSPAQAMQWLVLSGAKPEDYSMFAEMKMEVLTKCVNDLQEAIAPFRIGG